MSQYDDNDAPEQTGLHIEFKAPIQSARVYMSSLKAKEQGNPTNTPCDMPASDDKPTAGTVEYIKLIRTKEYSNVSKMSDHDHLTDANWHKRKERMQRVFINCD